MVANKFLLHINPLMPSGNKKYVCVTFLLPLGIKELKHKTKKIEYFY